MVRTYQIKHTPKEQLVEPLGIFQLRPTSTSLHAGTVHFVFLDASESSDRSAMSCRSFVINYLKLYSLCDCTFSYTHFPAVAFLHKTYSCDSFPNGCSVLNLTYASANMSVDSRTLRSIAWAFAHLSTLVELRTYDWLSLKPLGNNRPQRRSKNIFY